MCSSSSIKLGIHSLQVLDTLQISMLQSENDKTVHVGELY